MTVVTKTVRFDAAHVLTNHAGLCKNLHGHTYRVDVSVADGGEGGADMVIDFKDLKRISEEVVCARFDHSFIYSEASEGETAENMARLFYEELKPRIPTLWSVRVWETADSSAEYRP